MKITMFAHFKEYHEIMTIFKSLHGFGGRCLKFRDVCMDFEPYFNVHNLVSVNHKSIIPGQMINQWWCQFINWLKFETRPSSLLNFGTAYSVSPSLNKVFVDMSTCSREAAMFYP